MPAAPQNFVASSSARPQTLFVVRLGPEGGAAPAAGDEVDWLQVIDISVSSGGRRPDVCRFAYDLAQRGERVKDVQTPTGFTRRVEVFAAPDPGVLPDDDAVEEERLPIFAGEIDLQEIELGEGVEAITVQGRIQPYHFGELLRGPKVWDPESEPDEDLEHPELAQVRRLDEDLVFNPLIDGKIEPNRSSKTLPGSDWHLWCDPECVRSDEAKDYRQEDVELWDLRDAIRSLCGLLNPDEEFIKNPDLGDEAANPLSNAPPIENLTLKRGAHLPDYLDTLLSQNGFAWHVAVSEGEPDGEGRVTLERRIAIYRRSSGPAKKVRLQQIGAAHDPKKDNIPSLTVELDIADLANKVTCDGAFEEYEFTIELFRAWPEGDDALTASELKKSDNDSRYVIDKKRDAWRLWVANEAARYSGTRTGVAPIPDGPGFHPSLDAFHTPRARKIGDCLCLDEDGKRREPFVEWWDVAEEEWRAVPGEWSYQILPDQIGLRFTGDTPPADLMNAGDDAKLRITGTVATDKRITATAERRDRSPNGREVELWIDVRERFFFRAAWEDGEFRSRFFDPPAYELGAVYDLQTKDDRQALIDYATAVQDVEESAGLVAGIPVAGIETAYRIGDVISSVDGRGISFNRNSPKSEFKKSLQVTGLRFDRKEQMTTLLTEPVDLPAEALFERRRNAD
jgi:hypothetical protein